MFKNSFILIEDSPDNLERSNATHKILISQSYNQKYGTANERRGPKISAALKGKPKPWVAEQKSKPIIAIGPWGEESYYPSAREAGRQLGIDQSHITSVLRGRRRMACGYTFRYDEK